ncbi:MAG: DUF4340 domain-containing protein [Thermodesulfobacteriota bacterium]
MNSRKFLIYSTVLILIAGTWGLLQFFAPRSQEEEKKQLLFRDLTQDKIEEIQLQRAGETIRLKKDREWQILQPLRTKAEGSVVDSLIRTLTQLKAERRYSEKQLEGPEFGLVPPRLRVSFLARGKWSELQAGNKTVVGNDYYVRVSNSPELALISAPSVQDLDRSLFDLRDKRVFSLTLQQVKGLEILAPGNLFLLEKTPEGWRQKDGGRTKLDPGKVESFLNEWLSLQAKGFAGTGIEKPEWGLIDPSYKIRLLTGDKTTREEVLSLGKEAKEKGLSAKSTLQNEIVFLPSDILKKIPQSLEDWKTAQPAPPEKKGS